MNSAGHQDQPERSWVLSFVVLFIIIVGVLMIFLGTPSPGPINIQIGSIAITTSSVGFALVALGVILGIFARDRLKSL